MPRWRVIPVVLMGAVGLPTLNKPKGGNSNTRQIVTLKLDYAKHSATETIKHCYWTDSGSLYSHPVLAHLLPIGQKLLWWFKPKPL